MVSYKLTRRIETRRINYEVPLDWASLSAQLSVLFDIPAEQVAVSYIDEDGDAITLSSQYELDDYYRGHDINELIKFNVVDLEDSRASSSIGQRTPISHDPRDTFGLPFNMDDDWERLPTGLSQINPFLTKTDSDRFEELSLNSLRKPSDSQLGNQSDRSDSTVPQTLDKGKGRALHSPPVTNNNNLWSTDSLLNNSSPPKPPVHVINVADAGPTDSQRSSSVSTPVPNQDIPMVVEKLVTDPSEASPLIPDDEVPDPPSPTLDDTSASRPSMGNDLAQLFTSLSSAIGAHPEVTENISTIIHNITSGAYLSSQRESVSQAAQQLSTRSAEELQRAEFEANQRVAGAIGGFFRVLASGADVAHNLVQPVDVHSAHTSPTPPSTQFVPAPPIQPTWHGSLGRRSQPAHFLHHLRESTPVHSQPTSVPIPPGAHAWWPHQQVPPSEELGQPKPTTAELRAQVEAAKVLYKAEKERYKAEKHERQQEKARKALHDQQETRNIADDLTSKTTMPAPALAINSRGQFPAMEIVNVPHRSHTIGHAPSHTTRPPQNLTHGPRERVLRRLEDMGFSANAYPNIGSQVEEQIGGEKTLNKDREDDIVTTLLDDLLAASPRPVASGSKANIPGGWN